MNKTELKHNTYRFGMALLLAAVTMLVLLPSTAHAYNSGPVELSLTVTLESPTTSVQGTPIVLHYKLTNNSLQSTPFNLGTYGTKWYTLQFSDEKHQSAMIIPDNRPEHPRGLPPPFQKVVLAPQSSYDGDIVVSQYFQIQHPGKYVLTFQPCLPNTLFDLSLVNALPAASDDPLHLNKLAIALKVLPLDAHILQYTADDLQQKIMIEKDGTRLRPMIDSLFSMPVDQVWQNWEALAKTPDQLMMRDSIAASLSRVPSNRSADILAEIAWPQTTPQPGQEADDAFIAQDAMYKLATMYNAGSRSLRSHIKALYWDHGVQIGDSIDVPTVMD